MRLAIAALLAACGGDDGGAPTCAAVPFADGDPTGHADPLHSSTTQARAGRVTAAQLPDVPSGLITWKAGDFVLANDRVAIVIEDAGDSDLYDPWGGRPVGLARVSGGKLIEPANFGELFLLTGRSSVVTEAVTVLNDGSDGKPAVIRARGKLHPLPFFESVIGVVYSEKWLDLEAAIDYSLAPGAEAVEITYRYSSPRAEDKQSPSTLHAFMYTKRTPVFQPDLGFDEVLKGPYAAFVDDAATSYAYLPADGVFNGSLATSGFVGAFNPGFTIKGCGETERLHAKIAIGGPGLDGAVAAAGRVLGTATRTITGTATREGAAASGVHVHATDAAGKYLTRALTTATGTFTLTVPATADVTLTAYRRGDGLGTAHVPPASDSATVALPASATIHVTASSSGGHVPARVQILPGPGQVLPAVPANFGEEPIAGGRLQVLYATTGDTSVTVPPGTWEVVVSRGYEYELVRQTVTVAAGAIATVDAELDHSVDTTGVMCGDFHVHTWRSNDSGDVALTKVSQAVADGLELPVRSDHEWVADFSSELHQLGLEAWAAAFGSIELTSFEVWGHMGVFPLTPDPAAVNAGAPKWQTFPTLDAPDTEFATLSPPKVFDAVRARPEAPIVIINHPRGGANYFDYVGFDAATGIASSASDWDTKFTMVEVFNDSDWLYNRTRNVEDWLSLLKSGRKVFAVGSSDSHGISTSPVGYPRTCIRFGTDDPRALTAPIVRDALSAGHATVSGGIYVSAAIGGTGPGDTTTGAGSPQLVDVSIQAATWIDATTIEVIVDGVTVDTIPIMPADADATNPVVRWHGQLPVQVAATGGFVVIAAYGAKALEPVHPGRIPFGVTEPIFVRP